MINFAELMEMLREEFEKEYRQKYLKEGGRRGLEELIDIFIEKGFRDEAIKEYTGCTDEDIIKRREVFDKYENLWFGRCYNMSGEDNE